MVALPLVETFSALADPTRGRMLLVLDGHELTVSELCDVLQLPQSTVSRHLKVLGDAGWVTSRRDGTSRYYSRVRESREESHAALWALTKREWSSRPAVAHDARRLSGVLARRKKTSQAFFATSAGQWDRMREELFGAEFALRALLGWLPSDWVIGDLGCGTGAVLSMLSPHVGRAIGVDASGEMLAAAHERLAGRTNVELRQGTLEALPLDDAMLDAAVLMLVLPHLPSPPAVVIEAARVLRPGGRLLVVDMLPHERESYRQEMGHLWLGFSEELVRRLLTEAGFTGVRFDALPPAAEAKGPGLFAATATRAGRA